MNFNPTALARLREDVGESMVPMILERFQEELSKRAAALGEGIDTDQLEEMRLQAHSIKSTARTVGLDPLADCAHETEMMVNEENAAGAREGAARLLKLCDAGINALASLRAEL